MMTILLPDLFYMDKKTLAKQEYRATYLHVIESQKCLQKILTQVILLGPAFCNIAPSDVKFSVFYTF